MAKNKVGRPKGSNKEETLAKLWPAARKVFAEKGYAQATFKLVAQDIGMSHAALYSYVDSKKALYLETLENTQTQLLPHYLNAFNEGSTLKERISSILLATAQEHDRDPSITGFLAAVPIEIRRHEELAESLIGSDNAIFGALEAIFDEAIAAGEIKSGVNAADLISALLGGGVGVSLFHYGFGRENLTQTMEVFIRLIESDIFA